ncbi:hypothetical protein DSO57_1017198 [Entomophthora muscae]|uniref:Uncharacterized protein n=1 Tax=Entomophthora muscae TaxID=34485 RepID=A0ACC2SHD6_9FUNG|nr:hypothetical protein DSO57_1017198 [Entomophthora muscae]
MDRKRIKVLSPGDAETIFCMGRIPALHQIVAELLENGYDANPRQIKVIVTSLPQLKVEVFDDGCGIPMYDFPLVGTLHATSKELSEKRCLQVRPLYSQEQEYYMGSKGEALHCLSTLGKLSITSRHEPFSAALTACLTNGRQVSLAPETRAGFLGRGTRVLMTDIFCKLPIRRRILELSFNKELSIIRSELRKYCLRFPGVAITMFVGSSATATFSYRRVMLLLLTNPKSLDLKGSFQQCFPEEYSEDMSLIQKRRMNLKVDLLISHHPSLHKTPQFIFLNKRADAANRIQAVIKTVLGVDMAKSLPFVLDIKVGEKASFGDLEYEVSLS